MGHDSTSIGVRYIMLLGLARPPTATQTNRRRTVCKNLKCPSIDHLLQFFHGIATHGLGCRLRLDHTRLLGERVDALACLRGGLVLELQIQNASELERSVFFFVPPPRRGGLREQLSLPS